MAARVYGCVLLCTLALASPAAAERVWVDLSAPPDDEIVREPYPLVEVRGWAGTGMRGAHDVVLVIDRSGSTWLPSGVDVDGDGRVGEFLGIVRGRPALTDPDDSIAQAELAAARRLITRLDSKTTRMGIVTFARTEKVRAKVGASREELLASLDGLEDRPQRGGTFFYGAIIAAMKIFEKAPVEIGELRHRSIVFLSDGRPNSPPPPAAAEKATVRAAAHAARREIRIYAFALGTSVAKRPDVFKRMVDANGGELLFVERPGEILDFVPYISLTKLREVRIENLTTGKRARAVRLFPDGTFDGYAPVAPGPNTLRITARAESGVEQSIERKIIFVKSDDPERLARLLKELELRTLETQLAQEARTKRDRALERSLEIIVEDEQR